MFLDDEGLLIEGEQRYFEYKGLGTFACKGLIMAHDDEGNSKATTLDASFQSHSSYNKIYWIVGGLPKYKDKFNLKNVKKKIVKAYIIGKNTIFFKKQIQNHVSYKISNNIKKALNNIYKDINLNESTKNTILFSPAAASFDQFINFENRGMYFKNLIKRKFKQTYV